MNYNAQDIDRSFVREFAGGGDTFGPVSSRAYRREHVRIAIFKAGKAGRAFHDSGMTYAEAYRRCYGMPLEMRATPRAAHAPIYDVAEDDTISNELLKDDHE